MAAVNHFRVAYDLRTPGRDYTTFYTALMALGDVVVPLESDAWVATTLSIDDVYARLRRAADWNDRVVVTHFGIRVRYFNIGDAAQAWLRRRGFVARAA